MNILDENGGITSSPAHYRAIETSLRKEANAKDERIAELERDLAHAVSAVNAAQGEFVLAGRPAGDRVVLLANVRAVLRENAELRRDAERKDYVWRFLWDLLDDIDTLDDAAKGNDHGFRINAYKIQRRRFELTTSDGYELTIKADAIDTAMKEGKK